MQTHVGVADHARSLQIMESQFDVIKIEKVEDFELRFLTNRDLD